jgi:hypothetical protein
MNQAWFDAAKAFVEDKFFRVPHLTKDPLVHATALVRVMREDYGISDPEVLTAGMLHDVFEDTAATEADVSFKFSPRVTALVKEVSHERGEQYNRDAFYEHLKGISIEAKWIKLADLLVNLQWMIGRHKAGNPVFRSHAPYIRHIRTFLASCKDAIFQNAVWDIMQHALELEALDAKLRREEEWW